ncbi:MAG: aminoglycoside phosphotransferase [Gammaproteobacteria bacterium]|nr:MAG: aminoglycoside phosphotransferase [Gammaproteobacteria bacterium]RLA12496.1 MAG: aminoglycoside phosphotransferase [Gammaproteobacteria bacterium]RLA13304.1 MAG: aminoglycoside phosphotransferase [Gammaproteobacteria bacterium]
MSDNRKIAITEWITALGSEPGYRLEIASADASFRRYFRLITDHDTRIVMDAPPDKESCVPFVAIGRQLRTAGLHSPEIFAEDLERGFLLLEDFGLRPYLDELTSESADGLYGDALAALRIIGSLPTDGLPRFDRQMMQTELALFRDWYLGRELNLTPAEADFCLQPLAEILIDNALAQPQVWVHRDYHSRNLMVCEPNPGILDFQDAVLGPLTYDLVSLLKDCYVCWPRERVEGWVADYFDQLQQTALAPQLPDFDRFLTWFDLMGVQRHMKAIGIFARLNHRDGKPGYLADIPRCFEYLAEQADRCGPLAELLDWLNKQGVRQ